MRVKIPNCLVAQYGYDGTPTLVDEIAEWCEEFIPNYEVYDEGGYREYRAYRNWWRPGQTYLTCPNDTDLVAFRLRWCEVLEESAG